MYRQIEIQTKKSFHVKNAIILIAKTANSYVSSSCLFVRMNCLDGPDNAVGAVTGARRVPGT